MFRTRVKVFKQHKLSYPKETLYQYGVKKKIVLSQENRYLLLLQRLDKLFVRP